MSAPIYSNPVVPAGVKPVIFVLTLSDEATQNNFQSSHARLLNELFERATVRHANTAEKAFGLFTQCAEPHAVFIADGGIARPNCEIINQRLALYAACGGIVIFGGLFAASRGDDLKKVFKQTWDLPWEPGSFHRTTLSLNEGAITSTLKTRLQASYSQKALHLYGVQKNESWYLPTQNSVIEEWVPRAGPITDFSESPIIYACYGSGHVGFIGDTEAEEGTVICILAMLGILIR
ncbi:hypothetical protein M441DRAFT_33803 [Trichoderma asperellum CBS 433.97]|uniref:ThuA-like domain-containing protein n=1 Tax=Trichoderma asperellum (strain ATCC 204424 / CBS 433.97 / NBRC 101777) TaxID=1042311 RepID=A0A2T3ZJN2_TRIA4|nr:hypothetical protein M441DRAFT_33803 [Trichoderma asperellum CBS 433.97]PTB45006.1 hypothetical protein M441DRAFT_33803 [Trichoderma asperellum CBS 433.97]